MGELLHHFGETAARLPALHVIAALRQGVGRRVERVHRLLRQGCGGFDVGVRLLEPLPRRAHLALSKRERALELGGDERVPARRSADLALDRVRALLQGSLLGPRGGPRLAPVQRLSDLPLALRERHRLREGAVERIERLPAPRLRQRVTPGAQRVRDLCQGGFRGGAGARCSRGIPLAGGAGGPTHGAVRARSGCAGRRERRAAVGRRRRPRQVARSLRDAARE